MLTKNIRLLSIFSFLVEFSLYTPVAIIYFSQVSGSYALGASILGIVMLASSIFEVPTGIWSDRMGRRKTVIFGSWAKVLSVVFYAIGLSYGWLVIGAILEGLSRAFYSGNNDALLFETLADEGRSADYGKHLGKISSYEHFAMALGALLGGIIANFSFIWLFRISIIPQVVKLVISYGLKEPKSRKKDNGNIYSHILSAVRLFVKNPKLRLLSISDTVSFATGEVGFQFRSVFLASLWPLWAIGLMGTLTHFIAGVSYYFSNQIIKLIGAEKVLLIRSIYGKLSGIIAYGFPSLYSPLILITPSVIYGAGQVAKNTLLQSEFTDYQRATMSSLNSLMSSLGFAIMSIVIGGIADILTPARALLTFQIISLPIILVYWKLFRDSQARPYVRRPLV